MSTSYLEPAPSHAGRAVGRATILLALALATYGALATFRACGAVDAWAAPAADTTDEPSDDSDEPLLDDADWAALHAVRGPPIADTLAAAYAAAGLDRRPTRGLVKRARFGGLVPWLTVRVGRDTSWQSDDPTIDRGMGLEVRATWRLDRLVFDGRELQMATIEAAHRRERRRLGRLVVRAYFTWRKAAARVAGHSATRSHAVAVEEAVAELDALTDGWFSEGLVRSRRSASEIRTP